jgi:ribosomal protein S21
LQVFVRDNNVDQALRVLKKKMQREGAGGEEARRAAQADRNSEAAMKHMRRGGQRSSMHTSNKATTMRLYIFKSDANDNLCAFAGDATGSKLPDQFSPWQAVGEVTAGGKPPHGLPRPPIEKAINEQGFQLWRTKAKDDTP